MLLNTEAHTREREGHWKKNVGKKHCPIIFTQLIIIQASRSPFNNHFREPELKSCYSIC